MKVEEFKGYDPVKSIEVYSEKEAMREVDSIIESWDVQRVDVYGDEFEDGSIHYRVYLEDDNRDPKTQRWVRIAA